jgi:hypothetical protein
MLGVKIIKQQRDPQHAALWRQLKKTESLPSVTRRLSCIISMRSYRKT